LFPKAEITLGDSELVIGAIKFRTSSNIEVNDEFENIIDENWNPKAHYREKIHSQSSVHLFVEASITAESRRSRSASPCHRRGRNSLGSNVTPNQRRSRTPMSR